MTGYSYLNKETVMLGMDVKQLLMTAAAIILAALVAIFLYRSMNNKFAAAYGDLSAKALQTEEELDRRKVALKLEHKEKMNEATARIMEASVSSIEMAAETSAMESMIASTASISGAMAVPPTHNTRAAS